MTQPIPPFPLNPYNPYSHREFVPIRAEAVGVTANNPFYQHNSSSRGVMNASHLSQHLVLKGAEEPIIQTGMERELGKHVIDIRMPHDGVIRQVIERYPATAGEGSIAFSPEQVVIYQLESTHEYDCFTIDLLGSSHRSFTYHLQPTEHMARVHRGQAIAGGTQLAKPSCIGDNGGAAWGLNLNTAFMSVDEVAEDCTYISMSAARRMSFNMVEKRILQCGTKAFPLNTYGNIDNYKIMPDIGDEVRPDAVLMVMRDYNNEMAPVAMSRDAVMRIDHLFDTANYLPLDRGRVVDIKVRRNMSVTPTLPAQMRVQLDKYYNGMVRFYTEILELYNELLADHRRRSGYVDKQLPMTPRFGRLVYDAMVFLDVRSGLGEHAIREDMKSVLRPEIAKEPIDEYMIEITVEFTLIPKNGYKLSGTAGD